MHPSLKKLSIPSTLISGRVCIKQIVGAAAEERGTVLGVMWVE